MGCGRSRPKAELVRFVRDGDAVVADPAARLPGRGAYLCPAADCARAAVARRGFERAFRAPVRPPENLLDCIGEWRRSESTR